MYQLVRDFAIHEDGLTMVEYAIAGALVAGTAVAVFQGLGTGIVNAITSLVTAINT